MHTYRILLHGLGNVGRRFLELIRDREALLASRDGLCLKVVGAADRGGIAFDPAGLDLSRVIDLKTQGRSVARLGGAGDALRLLEAVPADLVLEASPTNLEDGEPGLGFVRGALNRGLHAVLAAKGPLVLAFEELWSQSAWVDPGSPHLRFSATVCGALPSVNLALRDLVAAEVSQVEGVLNLTTQIILARMTEGLSFAEALAETQALGLAETNPSLDVDGLDAACKLLIVAKVLWQVPGGLEQVTRQGIRELDPSLLQERARQGLRTSLLATATRDAQGLRLTVAPTALPPDHPLAHLDLDEGGILYHTDIYGRMGATCAHQGPMGTAAAMLRDVVDIAGVASRSAGGL